LLSILSIERTETRLVVGHTRQFPKWYRMLICLCFFSVLFPRKTSIISDVPFIHSLIHFSYPDLSIRISWNAFPKHRNPNYSPVKWNLTQWISRSRVGVEGVLGLGSCYAKHPQVGLLLASR
jgi:hypothetical protein